MKSTENIAGNELCYLMSNDFCFEKQQQQRISKWKTANGIIRNQ